MTTDHAVDLVRQALSTAGWLCLPVLAITLVTGLICGVLQAATQVQEQSLSGIPRLVCGVAVLLLMLPWGLQLLVEYTRALWQSSP